MSLLTDKDSDVPSSLLQLEAQLGTKDSCKDNSSTDHRSENETDPSANIQEQDHNASSSPTNNLKAYAVEEQLDSNGSSASSGVVSPCPSSVNSLDSSHKSKNESHNDAHVAVLNQNTLSEDNCVDCEISSEGDQAIEKSSQNMKASSQSGENHQQNRDESSTDGKVSLRERSDSVPNSTSTRASPASSDSTPKQGQNLRRGKWTLEEEAYVARVIHDFNNGFLDAPAGTTLRSYLSDKLSCDPMRITKKFTGDACIGKRVFHPALRIPGSSAAMIDKAQVSPLKCVKT